MPRPVDLLLATGPIIGGVAIALVAARQRLVRRLRNAGATDEPSAVPLAPGGLGRFWVGRLFRARVLGESSDGRHWLEEGAWKKYQARRRGVALTILVLHLLGFAIAFGVRTLGQP